MMPRLPHNPTAYDDDWEDQPAQSAFHKWFLGVALPLGFGAWGAYAIITQHASLGGRMQMELHDLNALAVGAGAIGVAVFLHCHYFWGNVYNQAWFAVLGKIVGAIAFIAGAVTFIVRVGVLGRL